jgi:hypothetical protein
VTAPDGREWEIYASKLKLPKRTRGRLRRIASVPIVALRSLRSDEWTIEAVTFAAHRESMSWTTTAEYRGQVLAHVEGALARGDAPRPRNAAAVVSR